MSSQVVSVFTFPLSLRSKEKKGVMCDWCVWVACRVPLGWRFPGSQHAVFEALEECPVIGCFELLSLPSRE